MGRYFVQATEPARLDYDYWDRSPLINSLTVDDHRPINTGLVNHRGDRILRAPEPMGFHHPGDMK
jgi:hypothetical protein